MKSITELRNWARMIRQIRSYFESIDFIEVSTPQLVEAGAFEACIDSLKVSYSGGNAELNTSPEIEMKWLLAQAKHSLFQICKSYRDDPETPIHFREFTMLEFYRVGADYLDVMEDLKRLLQSLCPNLPAFETITLRDIILETTKIDIDEATDVAMLGKRIREKKVLHLSDDDTWDDMFLKILIEKVEPALNPEIPTLLTFFPASFAALAALDADGKKARRFELYWKGIELANGCAELTDVQELARRRETECEARRVKGKAIHPFPTRLFQAVSEMPTCAGVAVGLDRLFMALSHHS